jgi:hypothetical protein
VISPGGGGGRVVMAADDVERMMLARMDLDHYETQVIPDLRQRVDDLTVALNGLVAATAGSSRGNLEEAVARARRILADGRVAAEGIAARRPSPLP